uniref:hypothetical protein n=1 Tax=uncultured Allobacillus sp. TaxID=1638025 RepID=UPI0025919341|nr:hypothetical protein [uncultured Allobacillus sp.]
MPNEQQRNEKKFFSLSPEERQELEAEAVKSKEKKDVANQVFDNLDKKMTKK